MLLETTTHLGTTPRTQRMPNTMQVAASWQLDDWQRMDRFLILGAEGATYVAGDHELGWGSCLFRFEPCRDTIEAAERLRGAAAGLGRALETGEDRDRNDGRKRGIRRLALAGGDREGDEDS